MIECVHHWKWISRMRDEFDGFKHLWKLGKFVRANVCTKCGIHDR
jgi:hypothetical protein